MGIVFVLRIYEWECFHDEGINEWWCFSNSSGIIVPFYIPTPPPWCSLQMFYHCHGQQHRSENRPVYLQWYKSLCINILKHVGSKNHILHVFLKIQKTDTAAYWVNVPLPSTIANREAIWLVIDHHCSVMFHIICLNPLASE